MTKKITAVKKTTTKTKIEKKAETTPAEKIAIGVITGAHGIRGQVKVESLTDFAEMRFSEGQKVWLEKQNRLAVIEQSQMHKGLYLLKLSGIDDRDVAQSLLQSYLKIDQSELAELPEGEYYHFQLIGLEVYEGEKYWGTLTDIRQTGANDVYTIKTADGSHKGEILLPALKTVVLSIDLQRKKMQVKIPVGLLDE